MRTAQLEIHQEEFSFSAGHFTIFSATERETLHGHNYNVSIAFEFVIEHNGLGFDYRVYKKKIVKLCEQLNARLLLPARSPYLKIEEDKEYCFAFFNQKKMLFPKEDVVILPLTNITIEELSYWFLQKILEHPFELASHLIHNIIVKVYNGPRHSSSASWKKI